MVLKGEEATVRLSGTRTLRRVAKARRCGLARCGRAVMVEVEEYEKYAGRMGGPLSNRLEPHPCTQTMQILPFSTAFQRPEESSLDKVMMPLAVPFRRKSASLTLLMNASFMTMPFSSRRTRSSVGQSLKWTVSRHGKGDPFSWDTSLPNPALVAGSAPA